MALYLIGLFACARRYFRLTAVMRSAAAGTQQGSQRAELCMFKAEELELTSERKEVSKALCIYMVQKQDLQRCESR